MHYGITLSAATQGIGDRRAGLAAVLGRAVAAGALRQAVAAAARRSAASAGIDWTRIAALVLVSAGLVAVTAWQAASLKVGLIVCAGFACLAFVLMLAGRLLVRAVAPLANTPSFPLRHAVLHLSRPGNQTRVILLAVGLGAFFIVGVRSLQASLLEEFSTEIPPTRRTCS